MSSALADDLNAVWAGRLELRLEKHTDKYRQGYRGAITTVFVRCESAQDFVTVATEHLKREGCRIAVIENLSPLSLGHFEISSTVADLVEQTHQYPLQWTTFHFFKDDA